MARRKFKGRPRFTPIRPKAHEYINRVLVCTHGSDLHKVLVKDAYFHSGKIYLTGVGLTGTFFGNVKHARNLSYLNGYEHKAHKAPEYVKRYFDLSMNDAAKGVFRHLLATM